MRQIINKNNTSKKKVATNRRRKHPSFGTSKLEKDFAKDFLDKLGVRYIWQYQAKEIGRWFDYYLVDYNILIEIDGSYW